ncbi:MAG TPA: plastocyanin/azurin family copper-binding protein [Actinomycetota bacterium]|nr:plastocyanin/azurin family copper-binding protein [Actinomycetota bacterium]
MAAAVAFVAAACGGPTNRPAPTQVTLGEQAAERPSTEPPAPEPAEPRRVDPRKGGFEVGFGEYAVTLEAPAIRPGPVTFAVHNGGKLVHGFEIEAEGGDDDNSGPGGGDDEGFKMETEAIEPGSTLRVPLELGAGLYKVECWVDGHDDLGMEILLEVRPDAPLVRQEPAGAAPDAVLLQGFAFEPPTLEVEAGTEVTWTNEDPADHTVTAKDGSFDSGPFGQGQTFSFTAEQPGRVAYFCAIHPTMEGTIVVR